MAFVKLVLTSIVLARSERIKQLKVLIVCRLDKTIGNLPKQPVFSLSHMTTLVAMVTWNATLVLLY